MLLSRPGAIELYKQRSDKSLQSAETMSPLVVQSKLFAFAINPPPPEPVKPVDKTVATNDKSVDALKPPQVERPIGPPPKFKLLATACYTDYPDKSFAMLDLTGIGTKWYRVGEEVEGHTIYEVTETSVTLYQGDQLSSTVEMVKDKPMIPSLLKSDVIEGQPISYIRPIETITLPGNVTARDLPKLLEKHSMETLRASGAAAAPASTGPRTIFSTDPEAALSALSAEENVLHRGSTRPPIPTRTVTPTVRTPAPPPTPEQQKKQLDDNITDIKKLMGTTSTSGESSEDQKAWGELLKLLESERKSLDSSTSAVPATPTTESVSPSGGGETPATPPTTQPEPKSSPDPAPTPSDPAGPAADNPPSEEAAKDNPPSSTDNPEN